MYNLWITIITSDHHRAVLIRRNRRGLREWSGLNGYDRLFAHSRWWCTGSSVTKQAWSIQQNRLDGELLLYSISHFDDPPTTIANDMGFCDRIIHKYHSTTANGHLGREKTCTTVSRDFLWLHVYKWVRNWIRTCEICQRRVHSIAAGPPVPVADCSWGLPFTFDRHYLRSCARYLKSNKYPVFVERFNKMTNMVNVHVTITAAETAVHFIDAVFLYHGLRKISFLTVTLYSHLYCGKAMWGNSEWSMGW